MIIFLIFIAIGLAIVPLFLILFITLQTKIGNAGHPFVRWTADHKTAVMLAVWGVIIGGLLIAWPTAKKNGFFEKEARTVRPGDQSLPPLELQIQGADSVIVAVTKMTNGEPHYTVEYILRDTGNVSRVSEEIKVDITGAKALGYAPKHGQEVVMFFNYRATLPYNSPFELLPLENGVMTYAPNDPAVRKTLTVPELKMMIE